LVTVPFDVSIQQIADGVTGVGGVITILMMSTPNQNPIGNFSAMIEFQYADAARAYMLYFARHGIDFKDAHGVAHGCGVLGINTNSNPPIEFEDNPNHTRGVEIDKFPASAVWLLINDFGLQYIVRVGFSLGEDGMTGKLTLEFCSTFEAARFKRGIASPMYWRLVSMENVKDVKTPSDRVVYELRRTVQNVIDYVPANQLEIEWNVAPFNMLARTRIPPYGSTIRRRPLPANASVTSIQVEPSDSVVLGDSPAIMVQNDASRPVFRVPESRVATNHMMDDTKYAIVDGKIYALGPDDGGVYKYVSGTSLLTLKQTTIHLDHWATFWNVYCEVNNINLRGYFEYSRFAANRRAINERLGLPEGDARTDLADSPIPDVILNYINPSNSNVVHTNNQ
jgi:hypothetical protein